MSLIWGIHPERLLFINTPLWSTSLSHAVPFYHTPLRISMMSYEFALWIGESKANARGYVTKTILNTYYPHGSQTPPGTFTKSSHCCHSSLSSWVQCHGFPKQVFAIHAFPKKGQGEGVAHASSISWPICASHVGRVLLKPPVHRRDNAASISSFTGTDNVLWRWANVSSPAHQARSVSDKGKT